MLPRPRSNFVGPKCSYSGRRASCLCSDAGLSFWPYLALKCSMFRNDKADVEKKIRELEQSLESTKAAEKEALEAKVAADAQSRDALTAFRPVASLGKLRASSRVERPFFNRTIISSLLSMLVFRGFVEGFDQSRLDSSLDGQLQPYPNEAASDPSGEDEFASLIDEIGYVP
ncbi:hypothetical protein Salat_1435600 [Sesamum alatum]|uniref:Uncharacterized protein n=1 Tax=Sesamum alatum TaxID=300844 RepID=A0AAE1YAI7_9LAMI|nr:hypothetical protein Salat_1435600 [Sesamum alatum]